VARTILKHLGTALANPAWVCFTWFGMTAGVSLLSTTARFASPLVTRPVALDIGRVTFEWLNKAELAALVLLLIVVRVSGRSRDWWVIVGALVLIVIAQTVWLLPELAARTDMVTSGIEPPPSAAHALYSISELVKLGLLFAAGVTALASAATEHKR
jgi:hypothetical protein